jgi:polar amino acid transport system substrate-binding protein
MAVAATLLCCAIAACGQAVPNGNLAAINCSADMPFKLLQIQANVQGSLNDMDSDVANASVDLSETGLDGDAARGVLDKLLKTNSNLVEGVTVGKDGRIIVAECKGCEGGVGANISSQEHIARILKAKTPALSDEFMTVEGYNATALAYPVFSPQGEFLGGISATFEPERLLNAFVSPMLNGTGYSFWVMQLDGLIAYDRDSSQIGKYLFEDPLYTPFQSLLALGHRMVADRAGHGSYSFQVTEGNMTVVTKDVYWTTAGLHGKEWRLAITRIMQ